MSCHSLVSNLCGCLLSWVKHALSPHPPTPIQPGTAPHIALPASQKSCSFSSNIVLVLFWCFPNQHIGQTCLDQRRFRRFLCERRPTDQACASWAHWAVFILRESERENEWVDSWKMDYWMVTVWGKLKWIVGICWGSKERWKSLSFLNVIWWTPINEYGPSLSMSVHMVTSVHVGEPVIVWHATSSLKETPPPFQPDAWPSAITLHPLLPHIQFCSLTHFPYFTEQLNFLLCLCQHVAFAGSHGVLLNTLILLPSDV